MNSVPLIIAHRGASGITPENTIESIFAARASGSNLIEIDLQLTNDGEIVLFHDRNMERIIPSEGKRTISDFSYSELANLDVGSWYNPNYSHCRIPNLETVLKRVDDFKKFNVDFIFEIKSKSPELLIEKFLNLLDNNHYKLTSGYISVRDEKTYDLIKASASSKLPIGLMQKKRTPKQLLDVLEKLNIKIAQIRPKLWSDEDWKHLTKSKCKFTIFYGDTPLEFQDFINKRPYGILTNFPARLKSYYLQNSMSTEN